MTKATIGLALAGVAAGGVLARTGEVGPLEQRWFRLVNQLPPVAHPPTWAVMQLGSLGGALAVGGAVAATGRTGIGLRAAGAGTAAWVAAKASKRVVRRRRPTLVDDVARVLGRPAPGHGYPSGHAAVAAAVASVLAPEAPRRFRPLVWATALLVGPARMYVGVHLPLDIAGGVALGVAIGAGSRLRTRAAGAAPAATR